MKLVLGKDQIVSLWVAAHIPHMGPLTDAEPFGPCAAIGVVDHTEQPVAGVVFHGYQPSYRNIEVSCAAESSRWLTKSLASAIMSYPFVQLGVGRITASTPATPTSAMQFLERFGFVREGVIRKGLGNDDAVIWGLTSEDWARSRYNCAAKCASTALGKKSGGRSRGRRRRRAQSRETRAHPQSQPGLQQPQTP